jgi:hypothetical protein
MRRAHILAAAISVFALIGVASPAFAESAQPANQGPWGPQPTHRFFQWNQSGRWSLRLDMSEPVGRNMQMRDVQAGAYYRVTPSLRVGGAVSLGDAPAQPDRTELPQNQAPRVKLETNFKF